jgi:hypothetical protein
VFAAYLIFAGRSGEDLLDGRERKLAQRLGIELYRDGITCRWARWPGPATASAAYR